MFAERGEIEWLCPWLPVHGRQRMHETSSLSHMRSSVSDLDWCSDVIGSDLSIDC